MGSGVLIMHTSNTGQSAAGLDLQQEACGAGEGEKAMRGWRRNIGRGEALRLCGLLIEATSDSTERSGGGGGQVSLINQQPSNLSSL
jgi:hypothetical protein